MPLDIEDDIPRKRPSSSVPTGAHTAPAQEKEGNFMIPVQSMLNWKPSEELQKVIDDWTIPPGAVPAGQVVKPRSKDS